MDFSKVKDLARKGEAHELSKKCTKDLRPTGTTLLTLSFVI
jgi:hypothetical protein